MPDIPKNLVENQWLNISFASLILVGVSIIYPDAGEKYIKVFFLSFVYGLLSFFVNSFFVKVIYEGKKEGKDRRVEYGILLLILIGYLYLVFTWFQLS